jgi:hypothetical protein
MMYGLNPNTMIIVILIVLQWFRVGNNHVGITPEPGLLNNGGLFIITLFLLVYCGGCGKGIAPMPMPRPRHCGC